MFVFSSVEIDLITPVSVIRHCSSDKIQHLKTPHNPPQKKYKKKKPQPWASLILHSKKKQKKTKTQLTLCFSAHVSKGERWLVAS